jgi:hypothetical protein
VILPWLFFFSANLQSPDIHAMTRFREIAALDGHLQGRTIAVMRRRTKASDIGTPRG